MTDGICCDPKKLIGLNMNNSILYNPGLHKVISQAKKRSISVSQELIENTDYNTRASYLSEILEIGKSAICFNIGDLEDLSTIKPIESLIKLPFDTCWIEGKCKIAQGFDAIFGMLASNGEGGYIKGTVFQKQNGADWALIGYGWLGGEPAITCPSEYDPTGKQCAETVDYILYAISVFLSAINCTNIDCVEHKPSRVKQAMRGKNNKKPIFSYWTLEIKQTGTSKNDNGGTHTSPRVHLRRGHARQYSLDKWCWVQACVVGNKKNGVVHKDYQLAK